MSKPTLPPKARSVLNKMRSGVAQLNKLRIDGEEKLRKLNDQPMPRDIRVHIRKLEDAKRDLSKACAWLKYMDRWTAEPFEALDPAIGRGINDTRKEIQRRLDWWHRILKLNNSSAKRRGAPSLPEEIYEIGAVGIIALTNMGIKRSVAANAVAESLKPLLPERRKPANKDKYEFTGRSLWRGIQQRRKDAMKGEK